MFKAGQEIICVKNYIPINGLGMYVGHLLEKLPIMNRVYTCEGYGPKHEAIYLKGFYQSRNGHRVSFVPEGFRPLDEVLSEISIEELIANPELQKTNSK